MEAGNCIRVMRCAVFFVQLAVSSLLAGVAFASAEAPRPDIVGQIVSISPSSSGVTVKHKNAATIEADTYQPLYHDDVVRVTRPGVTTVLEFAGDNNSVTLNNASGPFRVSATSEELSPSAFRRFLQAWSAVFSPPAPLPEAVSTTPRDLALPQSGADSAGVTAITASPFLPLTQQNVRGRPQDLTVLWIGAPADVFLKTDTGREIGHASPMEPGFAVVHCSALEPGRYRIEIGGKLNIPVKAVDADLPELSDAEFAGQAADVLEKIPAQKLQALSDLRSLSRHNYLAFAVLRWVRAGQPAH